MNDSSTNNEKYSVEGMTCSGCERTVSKVISNMEGVKSAKADVNSNSISLEYDPKKVSVEKMRAQLQNFGYKIGAKLS